MLNCFGRILNPNVRLYVRNKTFTQKYFSVLYPINHEISVRNKRNELYLKTHSTNELQFRNFSMQGIQSWSTGFYDFVTSSTASKLLNDYLIQTHDITGLPWWGTLVLSAAALKLFVAIPAGIYQQHIIARLNNTKTELAPFVAKLKEEILVQAKRGKWTKQKANLALHREVKKHMKILVVKNNCHPFKAVILNLSQIPFWVLMSLTIRKYAYDVSIGNSDSVAAALQFQVGGPFWCSNLCLPDSTLIIPFFIALTSLIAIEFNTLSPSHVINLVSKFVTLFLRCFAVFSFFISSIMPASVSLFWLASVVLGLAQNILFKSPSFRRFCRIPKTSVDSEKPYSYALQKFKEKWF